MIGVVSDGAPAYALSLRAGRPIAHEVTTTLADGMACRVPEEAALAVMQRGLSDVVTVSDDGGSSGRLIQDKGMIFSGTNGDLMEIIEIPEHPFFFGSQFHPEFIPARDSGVARNGCRSVLPASDAGGFTKNRLPRIEQEYYLYP